MNYRARDDAPVARRKIGGMRSLLTGRSPDLRRDIRPGKHEQENQNGIDRDGDNIRHRVSRLSHLIGHDLPPPFGSFGDQPSHGPRSRAVEKMTQRIIALSGSALILACALGVGLVPSTGSGATWFLCKKASIIQRLVRTYL